MKEIQQHNEKIGIPCLPPYLTQLPDKTVFEPRPFVRNESSCGDTGWNAPDILFFACVERNMLRDIRYLKIFRDEKMGEMIFLEDRAGTLHHPVTFAPMSPPDGKMARIWKAKNALSRYSISDAFGLRTDMVRFSMPPQPSLSHAEEDDFYKSDGILMIEGVIVDENSVHEISAGLRWKIDIEHDPILEKDPASSLYETVYRPRREVVARYCDFSGGPPGEPYDAMSRGRLHKTDHCGNMLTEMDMEPEVRQEVSMADLPALPLHHRLEINRNELIANELHLLENRCYKFQ